MKPDILLPSPSTPGQMEALIGRDGRRKACRECRQQKIRCDAQQRQPQQCTRCKRMGLDCIILPTSAKSSRRTKADLQRELDSLKSEVQKKNLAEEAQPHYPSPEDVHPKNLVSPDDDKSVSPSAEPSGSVPPLGSTKTVSRTLGDVVVDAEKIDDCFALFFQCYHPLLPILDPVITPNACYKLSRYLFWMIVITGARRYTKDRALLGNLRPHTYNLSFIAIQSYASPVPTVQGLLLISVWPMPVNSVYKDITSVLCGAAMHLAILAGLHVAGAGHEFLEDKVFSDPIEKEARARLWMYVQITCQTTSVGQGMPPMLVADSLSGTSLQEDSFLPRQPEHIQFRWKCHRMFLTSFTAIVRAIPQAGASDQRNVLGSMVSLFDSQMVDFSQHARNDLDRFLVLLSRVHLMAFYFFEPTPSLNMEGLVRLWGVALSLIDTILELDRKMSLVSYWPAFVERSATLTAITILRLSRSTIAPHLDLEAGEQAFFNAVKCFKKASLHPGDLRSRAVEILSKLWANQDVFKYPDGHIDSLRTRIRSRLSMSILFDCFLWYKNTSLDRFNPFQHEKYSQTNDPDPAVPSNSVLAGPMHVPADPSVDVTTSTSNDSDEVMASMPITSMPMGIADDMNVDMARQFSDISAGWMVPDYDWAANFQFSADTLPTVPWTVDPGSSGLLTFK